MVMGMARLIDVDALIAEYDRVHIGEPGKARKLMEDAPTIDAVPVVRCKDCIHRHYVDMGDDIGTIGGCGLFGTAMMTCNDFCSYGERRTDNDL